MSILEEVKLLGFALKKRQWKLVTAESCTGGGLASYLTALPGSSDWFERGFVTYSNDSKQELLGVHSSTLDQWGAVSEVTAREMAEGALKKSRATLSIAITGIAGPEGGSLQKPVGTVWFGWKQTATPVQTKQALFEGDRFAIREQAIHFALVLLQACIEKT